MTVFSTGLRRIAVQLLQPTRRLAYFPQTFQLVWTASQHWTLAWMLLLIAQGLLPAITVYLTRWLVDSLVLVLQTQGDWQSFRPVLLPTILMGSALLVTEVLQGVQTWVRTAQSELVEDHINQLIHQQAVSLDYSFYELSEYYDRLSQAHSDSSGRILTLLESTGSLSQNGITLIAMAAILLPYGVWLPMLLLVSTVPALFLMLRRNRRNHAWWERTTTARRRARYYDLLLTDSHPAAEVRLFNLGPYFQAAYQSLRQRLRTEEIRLAGKQALEQLGGGLVALSIVGIALLWMGWKVIRGEVTLGDLALFYQAFNRGQGLLRAVLGNLGQIHDNSLFLSNLYEFLHLKPQLLEPSSPRPVPGQVTQAIQFHQVSFCYPGSDHPVLENFSLTIPAGQMVAIVGDNGAGKSTLVKLLCRFYDPSSGCITLDGIDIRHFSVTAWRRFMTVLFQSPMPYFVSAAENIALGDIAGQPEQWEIERAAQAAGAHELIRNLPQGYATLMGKWFPGGTDLSGGEWQRLALARAFLRRAPLMILDEPTSALDPWSEADWLDRFRILAQGRTALVITHRFTLAMRADLIYVMRQGQIVESGRHDQLLAQGGLYAQSWQIQMQTYTREMLPTSLPRIQSNPQVKP